MDEVDWQLIKSVPLFGALSDETVRRLIGTGGQRQFAKGTLLFQQGELADAFYVILSGWVKINRLSREGEETIIGVFSRGQTFAEAAMFLGGRYPVNAEIISSSRLIRVDAARFRNLIHEEPDIALAMLSSCSTHLKFLIDQIEQMQQLSVPRRVANFLVGLCSSASGPSVLTLPYEKLLIAKRLGMKPESFSRALLQLRQVGVEVDRETVTIADVTALADYAKHGHVRQVC